MSDVKKPRSDIGKKRVVNVRPPERFTISLKGYGVDAQIADAIETDLKRLKKTNLIATPKTVLVAWLTDYLGLNKD